VINVFLVSETVPCSAEDLPRSICGLASLANVMLLQDFAYKTREEQEGLRTPPILAVCFHCSPHALKVP